jgi:ABC-type polysaccharide/polyol phosphate export permease
MIKNIMINFKKYSFLMQQMIARDFKVKYKRSVLGVLWSLLQPVLMMAVMALVFSNLFRYQVEGVNYLVYLMIGIVMFNYFSEATNAAMTSVIGNFSLINKVYLPKYIFPLSKCLFVGINFLLTLIPLLLIILVTGSGETKCVINIYYLLLPYAFICMLLFTVGLGFILSCIAVFFRDILYIYSIILTIWNYFTPVFYDISILPSILKKIFPINPLYQFITFVRTIILHNQMPSMSNFLLCGFYAITIFLLGCLIFKKKQDKFIYYL